MSGPKSSAGTAQCVGLVGPMDLAWKQTFRPGMDALGLSLVILWHSEWLYPHHGLWTALCKALESFDEGEQVRILVIVFGDTPDTPEEADRGNPLNVLLRALAEDADRTGQRGHGWASISDAARFNDAAVLWTKSETAALVRLTEVCAAITDWSSSGLQKNPVSLAQFFHFLADPVKFSASILHATKHREEERQRLCELKWLVTLAQIPQSLRLKILVVENAPKGVCVGDAKADEHYNKRTPPPPVITSPLNYMPGAEFYVVTSDFGALKADSYETAKAKLLPPSSWATQGDRGIQQEDPLIPWSQIDVVLQDVMLEPDTGRITGLDLVPFYFERCPQALVFLLTGLDIESLVVAGDVNWRYVDAVIPKDRIENLWFEYRRCFQERFGRMFWQPWVRLGVDDDTGQLGGRKSLRKLFGNLRKWQLEPAILGHGQGVQEMIDHAHRHVSAVWRLADDLLGTFLENCRPRAASSDGKTQQEHLSVPERMLFAISVWLHDIGHRGDDFLADSVDVRANHAGISEYLLLRNPEAFDIAWLMEDFCHDLCKKPAAGIPGKRLLECRNALRCKYENGELCPIRKVGLLCRHHQSNAPLDENSLQHMSRKGKAPSPYSRVAVESSPGSALTSQESLALWMDPDASLVGWKGSDIRRLNQFDLGVTKEVLISLAGLLRMLDALQLHRVRVGSLTSIDSFNAYLSTRAGWCRNELRRVEALVRTSPPGTKVYQKNLAE